MLCVSSCLRNPSADHLRVCLDGPRPRVCVWVCFFFTRFGISDVAIRTPCFVFFEALQWQRDSVFLLFALLRTQSSVVVVRCTIIRPSM